MNEKLKIAYVSYIAGLLIGGTAAILTQLGLGLYLASILITAITLFFINEYEDKKQRRDKHVDI